MALFRPAGTGRLITYLAPASQRLSSQQIRWTSQSNGEASAEPVSKTNSSDYATPKAPDTSMIRQEDALEGVADHQLNYHTPIDHGTSWEPRNLLRFHYWCFCADSSPQFRSGSWMGARKEIFFLLQCFPVPQLTSKHGQFGKIVFISEATRFRLKWSATEFIGLLRQPRNREIGTGITGGWIGISYRKVTDGRIRSWGGNPRPIACRGHI